MLGDVEAECLSLDRVLAAGLEDQPGRRARQAEQHGSAQGQEAQREVVVGAVVDREHIGQRQADLAAAEIGEDRHHLLEQQHRDQGDEPEIRTRQPQRRQGQEHAAHHGDQRSEGDRQRDADVVARIDDAGPVGAEPDEKGRSEVDFARKAEQQVPAHGEDREVECGDQHADRVGAADERERGRLRSDRRRAASAPGCCGATGTRDKPSRSRDSRCNRRPTATPAHCRAHPAPRSRRRWRSGCRRCRRRRPGRHRAARPRPRPERRRWPRPGDRPGRARSRAG